LLTRIATTESVFVMHADEKLTAFTELESVIQALPKPFLRQHRSCMPRQMEFVTLCCVAILVVSCSSIDDKIRSTPIADLRLRREQLIYRLNGAEWGPGAREHREDLYEEKEAIERELLPREKAGISIRTCGELG
jgi:hypothetical protein